MTMEKGRNTPLIRFKGFTDDWEQRKLGELLDGLYNGQTPSRFHDEFWHGDINWLSSGELNHGIVTDTVETITAEGQADANLRIVPKGTFVMAITGLEAAGTRGNCAILGLDTTLNQSCMALFPKKDKLTSNFIFHWYHLVGEYYGIKYTQGTKQQSYNAEIIRNLNINLPGVKEQEKISALLSHIDKLITLHQRKHEKLLAIKKCLLERMFPRKGEKVPEIRFKGFTDDWEQRKLGDIADVYDGIHQTPDYTDNGIMFLSVENINTLKSEKYISEEAFIRDYKVYPEKGDILMTRIGDVGTPNVVETTEKVAFYVSLALLKPINVDSYFLCNSILSPFFQNGLKERTLVTAIPQKINKDEIGKVGLYLPTLIDEQREIGAFFQRLNHLITLHQRKLGSLKALKKGLLQKMFM